ncbi:MAG: hypothetical protein ACKOUM_09105, partial [Sphingopyxis sp.]
MPAATPPTQNEAAPPHGVRAPDAAAPDAAGADANGADAVGAVDLLIVGGGLAGALVALAFARRRPELRVHV